MSDSSLTRVLDIIDEFLLELHQTASKTDNTTELMFTANSIGAIQQLRSKIENELS